MWIVAEGGHLLRLYKLPELPNPSSVRSCIILDNFIAYLREIAVDLQLSLAGSLEFFGYGLCPAKGGV